MLLGQPVIAAVLGLALGVGLLFASRSSFRSMTPDDPFTGLVRISIMLFVRLGVATLALWAYKAVAPEGLLPFALSFATGFLIMYMVELVRFAELRRYARPRSGPGIGGR